MKNHLLELVKGKKVLILGFGREGKSTYRILRAIGSYASLGISDMRPVEIEETGIELISGEGYLDVLDDYDVVFKSPGIVLPKEKCEYKCLITSQTEVFLHRYSSQTIGITGTKGKSTTSSLLYHILSENGVDCVFAGNIGLPVFEIADGISEKTAIVLEMSCHQLEFTDVSPAVAVLLNLYEDHLDHYGTKEKYCYAKQNIYRYQKEDDILFCSEQSCPEIGECKSYVHCVTADDLPSAAVTETNLRGEHNRFNTAVVYEICTLFGIKDEGFAAALATFSPLAHRLEYIGTVEGVDYYDDSISTTAESAISAARSIENAGTLLVGGMDRGIDYTLLASFIADCRLDCVIFMYESGKRVYDMVTALGKKDGAPSLVYRPDLASAVDHAKKATEKGKACILSPAAASYGYFKNFEERGDVFKSLVLGQK